MAMDSLTAMAVAGVVALPSDMERERALSSEKLVKLSTIHTIKVLQKQLVIAEHMNLYEEEVERLRDAFIKSEREKRDAVNATAQLRGQLATAEETLKQALEHIEEDKSNAQKEGYAVGEVAVSLSLRPSRLSSLN